jgi:hypothetical protein
MPRDLRPSPTDAALPDDEGGGRRGISPRVLAVVIGVQVALIGGIVALAIGGLPFGGDDGGGPTGATAAAAATRAVPAGSVPRARTERFDGDRALRLAQLQVDAGQRPAGSATLRRVAEKLRARLPNGRFEDVPGQPGLRNIVGDLPGPGPVVVVGAHYDTEYHPQGFVGANDAAAAVGAVVELARALRRVPRPAGAPGIRFVLFDGEEEPFPTTDFYRDALRGSKAYVQLHAEEVRAMVLLDYIGNKGVRLPRERTSTPGLWGRVRAAARAVGVQAVFPDTTRVAVFDDHTPFLRAGIPAVDLIDWSYRDRDTVRDTLDKLSADSIDAVGETMVQLLRTWPAGG